MTRTLSNTNDQEVHVQVSSEQETQLTLNPVAEKTSSLDTSTQPQEQVFTQSTTPSALDNPPADSQRDTLETKNETKPKEENSSAKPSDSNTAWVYFDFWAYFVLTSCIYAMNSVKRKRLVQNRHHPTNILSFAMNLILFPQHVCLYETTHTRTQYVM